MTIRSSLRSIANSFRTLVAIKAMSFAAHVAPHDEQGNAIVVGVYRTFLLMKAVEPGKTFPEGRG